MFDDSLASVFDPKILGGISAQPEPDSAFWSRPDGHIHIQHFRSTESVSYPPHTHSEYNIVIPLVGAVSKTQMGTTKTVEPGEAMMCNFGVEHSSGYLTKGQSCEVVGLTVDRGILVELLEDPSLSTLSDGRSPVFLGKVSSRVLYDCALDAARELRQRELGHAIVLDGLAMRILVETLRLWPRSSVDRCEVDCNPRLPRRDFVRAYEFMRWCRKDAFRLQHLCRFLGSSEERFARLFRAATNTSPAAFYNRMLLERGCDLLRNPALSVKEISYLLGFKTSSHFVSVFRRHFGMTALEYRHRCEIGRRLVPQPHRESAIFKNPRPKA